MRVIHGAVVLAGGLILIAAPLFAKTVPAILKASNFAAQSRMDGQGASTSSNPAAPKQVPHRDHKPKHGGIFFMSSDRKHHLEGVFVAPGTFRVYLYNEYTKPLNAEQTRRASGTLQVGESENAPKIALAPGKKQETLEAGLGNGLRFPVTITLLLHLPGMGPNAKPEVFNFKFTQFTDERRPGGCKPMPNMPDMGC
jgi:hypothetical protein